MFSTKSKGNISYMYHIDILRSYTVSISGGSISSLLHLGRKVVFCHAYEAIAILQAEYKIVLRIIAADSPDRKERITPCTESARAEL